MRIKEISYERVHNLGNYETERMGVVVSIDKDEKPDKVFEKAKNYVEDCLFNK